MNISQIGRTVTTSVLSISKKVGSQKGTLSIKPNFTYFPDFYEIKLGRKVVGNTTFKIKSGATGSNEVVSLVPKSWFKDNSPSEIKPFLVLEYIEILKDKGKGLGRKAMQLIYSLSKANGCEGRIALDTSKTNAGFYSHLGFDCPASTQQKFETLYKQAVETSKTKILANRDFQKLLHTIKCPRKTNGKFNADGIRFFTPTEENVEILFKK